MQRCPQCEATTRQSKNGFTRAGSQRYKCMVCRKKYTPAPKPQSYPPAVREQAIRMYADGVNLRRIGRQLDLHHQTVSNWVNAHVSQLPDAPVPEKVAVV